MSTETLVLGSRHATSTRADSLSMTFIGNATQLIRVGPLNILTDPAFVKKGQSVHLGYGLHTTRLVDPALAVEDLPPLDLLSVSHYHGDHFDCVAEERLDHHLPVLCTPAGAEKIRGQGFESARGLATWESILVEKGSTRVRITAAPGEHAPGVLAPLLPSVMGSVIEVLDAAGQPEFTLYISGDTLVYEALREIPRRFPAIDVAVLHLGGTRVPGMYVTMTGDMGVELLNIVRPREAVPIHYNDFDRFESPLSDFVTAVRGTRWQNRVKYVEHGDTLEFGFHEET